LGQSTAGRYARRTNARDGVARNDRCLEAAGRWFLNELITAVEVGEPVTKHIFVTSGVASSLGKGITAGTGFDGYVGYIADRLEITRLQRSPKPSSATWWTP
jgi:hypothetical protein